MVFADNKEFEESIDGYCFVDHRLAGCSGILMRLPLHMDPFALKVSLPVAVLVVLLAGVLSVVVVLALLTQQQKRREIQSRDAAGVFKTSHEQCICCFLILQPV